MSPSHLPPKIQYEQDKDLGFKLTRANRHSFSSPYPIINIGKLARANGRWLIKCKAIALLTCCNGYAKAVRLFISHVDGSADDVIILEVPTIASGSGWHLPLDTQFSAVATFKKISGGFNGQPASEIVDLNDTLHLARRADHE